jgi:hypothetical protein
MVRHERLHVRTERDRRLGAARTIHGGTHMPYTPQEIAAKRREIRRRTERKEQRDHDARMLSVRPSDSDLAQLVATFERKEGFPR